MDPAPAAFHENFPPLTPIDTVVLRKSPSPVVVAAFGVEWLRRVKWGRARWLIAVTVLALVSSILTVIGRRGGFDEIDVGMGATYLGVTFAIGLIVLTAFWLAHRAPTDGQAALIATAAVVGEQSVYLLLGNGMVVAAGWFAPTGTSEIAVIGGTRAFRGATGELSVVDIGTNATGCPNSRMTIVLTKQAPK